MQYKKIENFPNYKIYENGDVINHIYNRKVKISKNRFELSNNGDRKIFVYTKLLYELFNNVILLPSEDITFIDINSKNKYHYKNLIKTEKLHPKRFSGKVEFDKSKEWKIIKKHNNYIMSNCGDVYSIKLNKFLKITINGNGYEEVSLFTGKKSYKFLIHRLVYDTFIGLSNDPKLVIDHINRNRSANSINNLREVSRTENNNNTTRVEKIKDQIYQYSKDNVLIKKWQSLDEIKENTIYDINKINNCCRNITKIEYNFIWVNINIIKNTSAYYPIKTNDVNTFSNYKINKTGDIINKHNRLRQPYLSSGYPSINLIDDKTKKSKAYLVHRLVAMTFAENKNNFKVVNHLDKNRKNNNLNNLEWCTSQTNTIHALGKKVKKININTGEIKFYNSMSEAYTDLNKKYCNSIYRACVGKQKTAYGFKWEYA